jgi:hypothetical protein
MLKHITTNCIAPFSRYARTARGRKVFIASRSLLLTLLISAPTTAQVPCPPLLSDQTGNTDNVDAQCAEILIQQSDTPDYQDPLASCSGLKARRVVSVATATDLRNAVANASCGDTIRLAAGTYSSSFTINKSCPADNPVIIQGTGNFASVVSGRLTMLGARNIVTGIQFSGSNSGVICAGTNNKIIGNRLTGTDRWAIKVTSEQEFGVNCEIAYNEIYRPADWGVDCENQTKIQFRQAIKMPSRGDGDNGASVHQGAWVHHNYIHDWPDKPCSNWDSGDADIIEPGESNYDWSSSTSSGWYIEKNLIERALQVRNAVFDLKVGGIVARHNTVRDSAPGMGLNIRFGSNTVVESNWMENGGTVVHGGNHRVACNDYGNGPGVRLRAGDVEWNSGVNGHPRARNVLVAGNLGPLIVGHAPLSSATLPVQNSVIEDHTGSITLESGFHTGTIDNRDQASDLKCAQAVPLRVAQVGPAAMSQTSASYLKCRVP